MWVQSSGNAQCHRRRPWALTAFALTVAKFWGEEGADIDAISPKAFLFFMIFC